LTAKDTIAFAEAKAALLFGISNKAPTSESTEAGAILLGSKPYWTASLPVGGGGGGGGGGGAQHAEIPSAAAAKATKVKYLTIVICAVYTSLAALSKPIRR
jgi:hypothetical protein